MIVFLPRDREVQHGAVVRPGEVVGHGQQFPAQAGLFHLHDGGRSGLMEMVRIRLIQGFVIKRQQQVAVGRHVFAGRAVAQVTPLLATHFPCQVALRVSGQVFVQRHFEKIARRVPARLGKQPRFQGLVARHLFRRVEGARPAVDILLGGRIRRGRGEWQRRPHREIQLRVRGGVVQHCLRHQGVHPRREGGEHHHRRVFQSQRPPAAPVGGDVALLVGHILR